MAASAGAVYVDIKANTGSFEQSMSGLGGIAAKIGGAISAALTVKALANFAMECTEVAGALNEVQNVVDQVFPSMDDRIDRWSSNLIERFGLSELAGKRYASTVGSMARSMGFTEEQAYAMGTSIAELAGDVASFYDMSSDEAYDKLTAIFTGVTQPLRSLGINMTEASLSAFALSRGIQKSYQDMDEAERTMLRYQFVLDRTRFASGDFARTNESWSNQLRILSMNVEQLKATLGEGFIAALLPALQGLNMFISKTNEATRAVGNLMSAIGRSPIGRAVGKTLSKAGGLLMDFLGGDQVSGVVEGVTAKMADVTSDAAMSTFQLADASNAAADAAGAQDKATRKLNRTLAGFDRINKLAADSASGGLGAGGGGGGGGLGGSVLGSLLGGEEDAEKAGKAISKMQHYVKKNLTVRDVAESKWSKGQGGGGGFTQKTITRGVMEGVHSALGKSMFKHAFGSELSILDEGGGVRTLGGGAAFHIGAADQARQLSELWVDKTAKLTAEVETSPEEVKTSWKTTVADNWQNKVAQLTGKSETSGKTVLSSWGSVIDSNWTGKTASLTGKSDTTGGSVLKSWKSVIDGNWKGKNAELGRSFSSGVTKDAMDKSWHARIENTWKGKKAELGRSFADTATAKSIGESWTARIGKKWKAKNADLTASQGTTAKSVKTWYGETTDPWAAKKVWLTAGQGTSDQAVKNWYDSATAAWENKTATLYLNTKLAGVSKATIKNSWTGKDLAGLSVEPTAWYADGAWVERNTPHLAVIGDNKREGEIVSPESKFQTMLDKAAGQGGNAETVRMLGLILQAVQSIDPTTYLDGREITRTVVGNINRQVQSTGRNPLLV